MTPLRPRIPLLLAAALLAGPPALAQSTSSSITGGPPRLESDRTLGMEFKLGAFYPAIDTETGVTGEPYKTTFGERSMLLGELSVERQLFQAFGTAGAGFQAGYAEIFAFARTATGDLASESTGLRLFPLRLFGVYRFDWPAQQWSVPLVPYAKLGLQYTGFMVTKGAGVETNGGRWGYSLTGGLSLLLDFFEPRMARDFDTDLGVNHSYLFAEFNFADVNGFGSPGFNLSGQYFMFGLALEM